MQLFSAWKDSLTLLIPKNFKLFCLISVNALIKAYKPWLSCFWWLIGLYAGAAYYKDARALIIIYGVLMCAYILCVRPSVPYKDWRYFLQNGFLGLYMALYIAFGVWLGYRAMDGNWHYLLFALLSSSFTTIYTLLIFDRNGPWERIILDYFRALMIVFYNLPFLIIMSLILLIGAIPLWWGAMNGAFYPFWMLLILVYSTMVSTIWTNFYIKKVHEQYTLYFGTH
jgi:hypothetical protein